jgi:hypothetical protein
MRLLDTTTYVLSEFQAEIPAYAILSHVWEQEEVTFRDIAELQKAARMKGFAKIVGACKIAVNDGLKYVWIDTCCINKESSAELSEAINSMYMWYKDAEICYAYLSDVPSDEDPNSLGSWFAMSRWFTRGWTLQELLAPSRVVFYSTDWADIGTKGSLQKTISGVTGISVEALVGIGKENADFLLESVPVEVKMSWAAHRSTTRPEDMAYSLMGLFGVSMPLLYGEGGKASIRLQREISRASDDHDIRPDVSYSRRQLASQDVGLLGIGRFRTIFVTAMVPAEYGKLRLFEDDSDRVQQLSESEWTYSGRSDVEEGLGVVFGNGARGDRFVVTLGSTKEFSSMWCSVQTSGRAERNHFSDRSSTTLNDGWAVTVTTDYPPSSSRNDYLMHAKIEINHAPTPLSRSEMPEWPICPYTHEMWLVTPPAPHLGYTLGLTPQVPPFRYAVGGLAHRGSLVVRIETDPGCPQAVTEVLVNRGSTTGSLGGSFYLLIGMVFSVRFRPQWKTLILQEKPEIETVARELDENGRDVGASYGKILDGGQTIYVTTWRSRENSLADFVVRLSIA